MTIKAENLDKEQLLLSSQMAESVGQGFTVPDIYSAFSGSLGEKNGFESGYSIYDKNTKCYYVVSRHRNTKVLWKYIILVHVA